LNKILEEKCYEPEEPEVDINLLLEEEEEENVPVGVDIIELTVEEVIQ